MDSSSLPKKIVSEKDTVPLDLELVASLLQNRIEDKSTLFKNFNEYLEKNYPKTKEEMDNFSFIERQIERETHQPIFDSDSPLTMGSSVSEGDDEDDDEEEELLQMNHSPTTLKRIQPHGAKKYRKLTYKEVERSLEFNEDDENKCINELDILITYLKGQTHLYSLSQYLTQQKINILTIPSFVFSVAVTILAPLIHYYEWSGIFISALTASIASLSACVQFYQLDASCTTYLYLTNQYNKMQVSLETFSNSFIIGTGNLRGVVNTKEIIEKIRDVEQRITDIKDSNNFLPPEEVKLLIPIISHINIFSFIKKMKLMKKSKISRYREIKNEIRFILNHWEQCSHQEEFAENMDMSFYRKEMKDMEDTEVAGDRQQKIFEKTDSKYSIVSEDFPYKLHSKDNSYSFSQYQWKKKQHQLQREKNRMSFLIRKKNEIRKELNYYRNAYSYIDELFTREINIADNSSYWWVLFRWWLGFPPHHLPKMNPVVDKYLEFIFINQHSSWFGSSLKDSSLNSTSRGHRNYSVDTEDAVHSFDENLDIV